MGATDDVTLALVLLLAVLVSSATVAASEYQGESVEILDDDTIEVLHSTRTERIRLNGIDCPEKGHALASQ